jgi:hypothetical protein
MKVSIFSDKPAQSVNIYTYLGERNPMLLPFGSINGTYLNLFENKIKSKYGNSAEFIKATSINEKIFDKNFLFPLKNLFPDSLKGGVYVNLPSYSSGNFIVNISTIINTRSPSSMLFWPTFGVESLINTLGNKNISITVVNHPMPLTFEQKKLFNSVSSFFGPIIFSIALSFKFASVISFLVK